MNRKIIFSTLLISWIIFSSFLLLLPLNLRDFEESLFERERFSQRHLDKFAHFSIFAIMSILFYFTYKELDIPKHILYAILSAFLLGIILESLQFFVPARTVDFYDYMFNTLGSLTSLIFIEL